MACSIQTIVGELLPYRKAEELTLLRQDFFVTADEKLCLHRALFRVKMKGNYQMKLKFIHKAKRIFITISSLSIIAAISIAVASSASAATHFTSYTLKSNIIMATLITAIMLMVLKMLILLQASIL